MSDKIETKQYPDGTSATGVAPLPKASPREVNDFPPLNILHDLTQAQMALVDKLWLELRDNPKLRYARQRLSLHELREIVRALVLAVPPADKDAERYRWLRTKVGVFNDGYYGVWLPCGNSKILEKDWAVTDAAIDAAMAKGQS